MRRLFWVLSLLHSCALFYVAFAGLVSLLVARTRIGKGNPVFYATFPMKVPLIDFWPALLSLAVFMVVWGRIVFFPLDFGHRDEIALLTHWISPPVFSGRFFPLGHMEFDLFRLNWAGGWLAPLYFVPFIEIIAFVFLVDVLVRPASWYFRIYALFTSFFLAAIVAFSNLIVPERNVIVLFLLIVCCVRHYYATSRSLSAILAVYFSALMLYYKEPVFAALTAFSLSMAFYRMEILWKGKESLNPKALFAAFGPVETGQLLGVVLFVIGYLFYTYYGGGPESYYVAVSMGHYGEKLKFFLTTCPLLSLLLIVASMAHFVMQGKSLDRALTVAIASSGVGYLCVLCVLGVYLNGYYFAFPLLALFLASTLLLNHLATYVKQGKARKIAAFASVVAIFGLIGGQIFMGKTFVPTIIADLRTKINYQYEYAFLREHLRGVNALSTLYYAPRTKDYNDYATAVLMMFTVHAANHEKFSVSSSDGCSSTMRNYNNGAAYCIMKDYNPRDTYDVLVVENNAIGSIDKGKYKTTSIVDPFSREGEPPDTLTVAVLRK